MPESMVLIPSIPRGMAGEAGFCRFEGISCRPDGPSIVEDDAPLVDADDAPLVDADDAPLVDADDVPLVDAEESPFSFCLPCPLHKPSFSWK